ncbi:unnamed protein product [Staurois parvus]|uniref:Uncharacterized protein n=1 Tax=Staurois parvus TaxID=386267 RepID=A0ABN9GMV1_9NEOB|nr:unnamed protein product [Staurois parvus]
MQSGKYRSGNHYTQTCPLDCHTDHSREYVSTALESSGGVAELLLFPVASTLL